MIKRSPLSFATQVFDLLLIELSNFRWAWRSMVITGMLAPITFIVALHFFTDGEDPDILAYILTGNVVLSLMFETLNRVSSHFAYIRFAGTLDYFATLPVSRPALMLAVVLAFLLLSLPALLTTVLFGALFLQVALRPHLLLLLAVPLAAIPLSGLGAFLGVSARTPEEAGSWSTVLTLLMLALGPVLIPAEQLPPWLVALGALSPATYAASALRQTLLGPATSRLLLDLAVLTGLSLFIFWLVGRRLDWRQQ